MFGKRLLRASVPALGLAALCLGACGSDQTDSGTDPGSGTSSAEASPSTEPASADATPSEKPTPTVPPGTPDCSAVWSDGATLPRSYQGCADGGDFVRRDVLGCSSGQRMVRYADRYYAVFGGTVHQASTSLEKDRDYRAAVLRCRA